MIEVFAAVGDVRLTRARLVVAGGPWFVDCDFEDDTTVAGRVTVTLGELALEGTVAPRYAGTHATRRQATIVAGAGGWGAPVGPKAYHNDAGVKARQVAEDAARAVGETLGTFEPAVERVGIDYLRQTGPAARALEDVIGGASWWVDFAGVTHVGARAAVAADVNAYEVLEYDPRARVALLAVDDLAAVDVGSILTERLDEPQTIRELEIIVEGDKLRVKAWCGEDPRGRLVGLMRDIAARATDAKLFGCYRYRVAQINGDRLDLQAVSKARGLPDALPISVWPGVPSHIKPKLGSEVLVEFIAGERTDPIVRSFQSAASSAPEAARKGDAVEIVLPPAVFTGLIGGAQSSGVITFTTFKTQGVIIAGSGEVRIP